MIRQSDPRPPAVVESGGRGLLLLLVIYVLLVGAGLPWYLMGGAA